MWAVTGFLGENVKSQLKQLQLNQWPALLNDEVAMISLEPADIQSRCGLQFDEDLDDLDYFDASVAVADGRLFGLMRYRHNPVGGTIIVVEDNTFDGTKGAHQLKPILDALGASLDEITWIREIPNPGSILRRNLPKA